MIEILKDLPDHVVGFRASGTITKEDYQDVVTPEVARLVKRTDALNFLLLLDTDVANFTAGAWVQEALIGLKNLTKWNRSAIVTDSDGVINFTNGFTYLVPGEFMGFKKENYDAAVSWISGTE